MKNQVITCSTLGIRPHGPLSSAVFFFFFPIMTFWEIHQIGQKDGPPHHPLNLSEHLLLGSVVPLNKDSPSATHGY